MIRLPGHLSSEVSGIHFKADGSMRNMTMVLYKSEGRMMVLWEANQSTFLDRDGNPFYDRTGVPFQGKQI